VLWRHGQTQWNLEHRFQGQTDIPLDDTGQAQANQAAQRLSPLSPDVIVASDLTRAQQTAAALSQLTGLSVTSDKDLRERFGGDWEGLADTEIRERYPAERATWNPPNGEPSQAVAERVAGALTRIADDLDDGQLAVLVGHGAALRYGMEQILGIRREDGRQTLGPLVNCSWSVLERREDRWRLLEYNVVAQKQVIPEALTGDDVNQL
jgi:broad specificity phosphatase PhoE